MRQLRGQSGVRINAVRCVGGILYLVTSRAGPMRTDTWSGLNAIHVYSILGYIDLSFAERKSPGYSLGNAHNRLDDNIFVSLYDIVSRLNPHTVGVGKLEITLCIQ